MADASRYCANCAEKIPLLAVACPFCKAEAGSPPAAAPPEDTPERQERRRAILEQLARAHRRSWPFLVLGWLAMIGSLLLFIYWALSEEARHGIMTFAALSALSLLAGFGSLGAYLALRPRYTGNECPQCHDVVVRRVVRPGIATAIKVLRCDACGAEFGRTGF